MIYLVYIGVWGVFVFIGFLLDKTFGDGDVDTGVAMLFAIIGLFWPGLLVFFLNIKTTFFPSKEDIAIAQRNRIFEMEQNNNKIKNEIQQKFNSGNHYATLEYLKKSLMKGENTELYRKLGYMYENGYGTAKDYDKAMKCYEKANAWREIGYMHYFGYGVPKNKDKANEYFAKCYDIEDCKEVIEYFDSIERIASGKNLFLGYSEENALYNLGLSYTEGKGVYQDYQKALHYYKEAADLGHRGAYNNLGYMYDNGKGVARDYSLAVRYYQKAADLGNATACNNLGSCYENGRGGGVDKYKALKYYKKACDLGNQKGCENFKRLKKEMGITNDDDVLF